MFFLTSRLISTGRALAVVPHAVSENGYIDVNCDDNEGNDRMKWLQQMVTYMHGAQVPADKK